MTARIAPGTVVLQGDPRLEDRLAGGAGRRAQDLRHLGVAHAADLTQEERVARAIRQLADAAGLTAIVKARGLSDPAIAACFADKAATDKLLALSATVPADLQGTPTFYLNGKLVPNVGWTQLEPQLRAAGAR